MSATKENEWVLPMGWSMLVKQDLDGEMWLEITTPEHEKGSFRAPKRTAGDRVLRRLLIEWRPEATKELKP